jgi:hypothetical protein
MPTYPAITIITQAIQTALNDSPFHLDFYSEYMDTSLFPDPAAQQEFRDSYIRKYQNHNYDVIITGASWPVIANHPKTIKLRLSLSTC